MIGSERVLAFSVVTAARCKDCCAYPTYCAVRGVSIHACTQPECRKYITERYTFILLTCRYVQTVNTPIIIVAVYVSEID